MINVSMVNISQYAYELYKIDWESAHKISGERKLQAFRNYSIFTLEEMSDPLTMQYSGPTYKTFEDYIEDGGYCGELYPCYEDFLEREYQDDAYMNQLLKEEALIKARYEDLELKLQKACL